MLRQSGVCRHQQRRAAVPLDSATITAAAIFLAFLFGFLYLTLFFCLSLGAGDLIFTKFRLILRFNLIALFFTISSCFLLVCIIPSHHLL